MLHTSSAKFTTTTRLRKETAMRVLSKGSVLFLALAFSAAPALATSITFTGAGTGPDNSALAAQASFDITGYILTVTLRNIATNDNTDSDQDVPGSSLTGVLFDLTGSPTLTPVSATVLAGAIINPGACLPG